MPCPQHPLSTGFGAGMAAQAPSPFICHFQHRGVFWGCARLIPGFSSSSHSSQHGLNISAFTQLVLTATKLEFDVSEAPALFPEGEEQGVDVPAPSHGV